MSSAERGILGVLVILAVLVTGLNPSVELVCLGIMRSPACTMWRDVDLEAEDRVSETLLRAAGMGLSAFLGREPEEELFALKFGECVTLT